MPEIKTQPPFLSGNFEYQITLRKMQKWLRDKRPYLRRCQIRLNCDMKRLIILITSFLFFTISCKSPNGNEQEKTNSEWEGFIKVDDIDLKLIFNLGIDKCWLDIPAQGFEDYPSHEYKITDDSVNITFSWMIESTFSGKRQADTLIIGKWVQSGKTYPLSLKKKKKYIRHQNPQPPFPYKIENVSFFNQDKSIQFGGTLTIPKKGDKHPVAILITGSGQQDRDETIFGHKPFLIIADYLTRHGIAVLRVDDRGVGKTTGKETLTHATSYDHALDVVAEIQYLKSRKEINPLKIGLIGHSEGGLIASIVGAKTKDLAFIVSMAGVGVQGKQLALSQIETNLKRSNPHTTIDSILAFEKNAMQIILEEPNYRLAEVTILQKLSGEWLFRQDSLTQKYFGAEMKDGMQIIRHKESSKRYKRLMIPWYKYFLAYSPDSVCSRINAPFLAINGEKDTQVLADLNLNGLKNIFDKCGKTNYKIIRYPGLNHFFQHCESGYLEEVEIIEETISPEVLADMTNWIKEQIKKENNTPSSNRGHLAVS